MALMLLNNEECNEDPHTAEPYNEDPHTADNRESHDEEL